MKNFFVVLLVLSSLSAYAAGGAGPLLSASSDPYQVLKSAFNNAQTAQISDFPTVENLNSSNPSMKCVGIDAPGAQHVTQYTDLAQAAVGRVDFVTPGNGPLFPGSDVKKLSGILTVGSGTNSDVAAAFAPGGTLAGSLTMTTSASGDLQSVSTETASPGIIWTTTYRKAGSLLFAHEVVSGSEAGVASSADFYAYCYPANQN